MLVHATPDDPDAWHYLYSSWDARSSFKALGTQLCFIGHSHIPGVFVMDGSGRIVVENVSDVSITEDKMYIINVGSVGQPRDGDPRACYGVFDVNDGRFNLKRCSYPVEIVQEKMQRAGLPSYLITRLAFGQ